MTIQALGAGDPNLILIGSDGASAEALRQQVGSTGVKVERAKRMEDESQ